MKNNKLVVFEYLNQNPDTEAADLYEQFPSIGNGSLRAYLSDHRKAKTEGTTPIASSAATAPSRQSAADWLKAHRSTTSPRQSAAETPRNDPDLDWLKSHRSAIEEMLVKGNESTSTRPGKGVPIVRISGSVRVRSYSIADKDHQAFVQVCEQLGMSRRKGVHAALRMFVKAAG